MTKELHEGEKRPGVLITYDPNADVLYVLIRGATVARTIFANDSSDVAINQGSDGEAVGVQIEDASQVTREWWAKVSNREGVKGPVFDAVDDYLDLRKRRGVFEVR